MHCLTSASFGTFGVKLTSTGANRKHPIDFSKIRMPIIFFETNGSRIFFKKYSNIILPADMTLHTFPFGFDSFLGGSSKPRVSVVAVSKEQHFWSQSIWKNLLIQKLWWWCKCNKLCVYTNHTACTPALPPPLGSSSLKLCSDQYRYRGLHGKCPHI